MVYRTYKGFAGFVVTLGVLVCTATSINFAVDVFQIQPTI